MRKLIALCLALMFVSATAYAQEEASVDPQIVENISSFEQCEALCAPYSTDQIMVNLAGDLVSCVCKSRQVYMQGQTPCTRCCTRGTSQPCGDACIALGRACHMEDDGLACFCDSEGTPERK